MNYSLRLPAFIPSKPTPKQAAFLMAPHQEAFYGGAASGGKSEALLMGALQYVDDPNYAAIIIRKSFTQLNQPGALMDRARSWLKDTSAKWDRENHAWRFPSGASLTFGYIATPADRFNFQSAEYQYVAFDEVTDFEDDVPYTFLFSRLRRKVGMEHIPLRMRCASNPVGPGVHWVKQRFLDEQSPDRIYIPADYQDNPHVDQNSYRKSLDQLHPALREKLLLGNWDAVEDAAFPEFDESIHVIPPIASPRDWRRWEAMDWGTTNPTAWYAAGLSPEGDTVIFGEYYKPGLISDHASEILTLRSQLWGQPTIALCDPTIQAATGFGSSGRGETVHSEFGNNGIHLVPANNDRRAGRVRISELLRADPSRPFPSWHPRAGDMGAPRLFLTSNCVHAIKDLNEARLDSVTMEIVDPYWETRRGHAMAALRYLVTARVYPAEVTRADNSGRRMGAWTNWNEFREREWNHFG